MESPPAVRVGDAPINLKSITRSPYHRLIFRGVDRYAVVRVQVANLPWFQCSSTQTWNILRLPARLISLVMTTEGSSAT